MTNEKYSESHMALLENFTQAWNDHDVDKLMTMMADDCCFYASAGSGKDGAVYRGYKEVRTGYIAIFDVFPDASWDEGKHFVVGDKGVSEWLFTGTKADGSTVTVRGCDLYTFKDGKIVMKDSFRKNIIA